MESIKRFFKFEERGTTLNTEIIAGLTTFMTMAYVLVLQPNAIIGFSVPEVIDVNGVLISKEAVLITTALVSGLMPSIKPPVHWMRDLRDSVK